MQMAVSTVYTQGRNTYKVFNMTLSILFHKHSPNFKRTDGFWFRQLLDFHLLEVFRPCWSFKRSCCIHRDLHSQFWQETGLVNKSQRPITLLWNNAKWLLMFRHQSQSEWIIPGYSHLSFRLASSTYTKNIVLLLGRIVIGCSLDSSNRILCVYSTNHWWVGVLVTTAAWPDLAKVLIIFSGFIWWNFEPTN